MSASRKPAAPRPARVSERDRAYFRRLGRFEQESHDEALAEHMKRPGRERLIYALQIMLDRAYFGPRFPSADEDNPAALYERARRLGLYRP